MDCFISLILLFSFSRNLLIKAMGSNSSCLDLRRNFAQAISEFSSCAVNNSQPITFCENCTGSYINIISSYKNMSKETDNGTKCIDEFVGLDRLQIVQTLYTNSLNLWNEAKCYECFEIVNGSVTNNRSKETKQFLDYHTKLMSCVNGKSINDTNLCPMCMEDYITLNEYYLAISNENEKIGVCMDLVDKMNDTWTFWSMKCCKYRRHSEYIFLASSASILLLTVLFYVIAQWCSVKRTPSIVQFTRFAESVNNFVD